MTLLATVATAILPVVVVAAIGFLLGRYRGVDPDPLNTVTVYVLAPALVFHSLTTTTLQESTLVSITLGLLVFSGAMLLLAQGYGRLRGYTEPSLGALLLVTAFPNVGNFGIPLSDFAFGATGRSVAILATAVQGVLLYTVGVYVAARGDSGSHFANMRRVLALPLVYAVVVALTARWLGLVPPVDSSAMQTLGFVGESSIPIMLLVLGIQLSEVDVGDTVHRVGAASAMRLLVAPILGLAIALAIGFADQTVARTFVVLTAAPAAVTSIILVGAFSDDGDAAAGQFVSATVLVTTLASLLTVTTLIILLETGALL